MTWEAMQRQFAEEWSLQARGPLGTSALPVGGEQGPVMRADVEERSSSPAASIRESRPRYTMVVGRDGRGESVSLGERVRFASETQGPTQLGKGRTKSDVVLIPVA